MTTPPLPPDDDAAAHPQRRPSADQEPSMTQHLAFDRVGGAAEHLTLDDLADLTVGELPAEVSAAAEDHLAGCEACRAELARLTADLDVVSTRLGALGAVDETGLVAPAAPMPVTVAARLDRVLAEEASSRMSRSGARDGSGDVAADTGADASGGEDGRGGRDDAEGSSGRGATVTPLGRSIPLMAPATPTYVKQAGVVRIMVAAAVAAAVVGFGGYVVSATAGLNEPSALSPTQVHPEALASQAERIAHSRDLDPHLFSGAWRCARKVTTGRITGITPVYVDGEQQYLVYTRAGGVTYATLISGCSEGSPSAGRSAKLTE